MSNLRCRFCNTELKNTFVDLGMSPLSNSYLKKENLLGMERFFPLHVFVCEKCFLVQLPAFETPEGIFSDYAYFSSYSDSWLEHCRKYVEQMNERYHYDKNSLVVEVASNDGYLLQYFHKNGIPVLGIEPAANVAKVAQQKGINSLVRFFGIALASELRTLGRQADLIIGNNVLAHVPDINDFVGGLKILLKDDGVITIEFPHLLNLIEQNQFDTIYHEHFSYLSLYTAEKIFANHDLRIFDVEEVPTHGGSLRIYGCHDMDNSKPSSDRVKDLRRREVSKGITQLACYASFGQRVHETKRKLLSFLIEAKKNGKTVVGYGAPAKGNTLLNYCGIRTDFLDYTVDRSPHKQGLFLPGTHIPIYAPEKINETHPDYVLILPWNLKDEISQQMAHINKWGGRFVVPIPEVKVLYDVQP